MKKKRVVSRLAKKESSRLFYQTILFFFLAIATLFGFIFIVLPFLFKVLSQTGDFSLAPAKDQVAPQAPLIAAPPIATNSAQLTINGFAEPNSTVFVLLNNQEVEQLVVDDEQGNFSTKIKLQKGENKLKFYAQDQTGNESPLTSVYQVVYDPEPPELILEQPQDGQQFELRKNQLITIKGQTEALATVEINGHRLQADAEGDFQTTYQLQEGDNKLNFVVTDRAGNQIQEEITVHFRF